MEKKMLFYAYAAMVMLLLASCDPSDPGGGGGGGNGGDYPAELDKLVMDAPFVIKGKVVVLNTSLTDEEDVSQLGVVEVTEVIDANAELGDIKGQQITVRFANISTVKEGEERLFFTEPYWFGEFLGVTEKGSVGSNDKLYSDKELQAHIKASRSSLADKDLARSLKAAPLVVAGKVTNVKRTTADSLMESEHDPLWMTAEIQVDEALSGKADGNTITVLFASSNDVMYYLAPKLKQGDDGIFVVENADESLRKLTGLSMVIQAPAGFVAGRRDIDRYKKLLK